MKNKLRNISWTILGITLMVVLVYATTTISDTGITSGGNIISGGNLSIPPQNSLNIVTDNIGLNPINETQSLNFYSQNNQTKSFITWWNNQSGVPSVMGWMGCHNLTNSGTIHQHCAFEAQDSDIEGPESKLTISWGTLRSHSNIQIGLVDYFRLGSGVDFKLSNGDVIYESSLLDIHTDNQTTIGLRIQNNSDNVVLTGLNSDEVEIASDLLVTDNLITLNNSGASAPSVVINRKATNLESSYKLNTIDDEKWALMMDDDGTDNLYIRNKNRFFMAMTINETAQGEVAFYNLSGSGTAYVCVDADGRLFRNSSGC